MVRTAAALALGLTLLFAAWALSYHWLPEAAVSGLWLAGRVPVRDITPGSLGPTIFGWNLLFGVGTIVLASLFAVGRLSMGYLAPLVWFLAYGVLLGTNSFAFRSAGKLAPDLDLLAAHVGLRELGAYLLVAIALADVHLWRQPSWRRWRLVRVRHWRDVRLGAGNLAVLAVGVGLLAWSALTEAAQIRAFLG